MTGPTRDYYRELALCALHRSQGPCTTDEVVELMGVTAQAEGHPRALWGGINPGSVSGYLRSLEKLGAVVREEQSRRDVRHGRDTPVWTVNGPRDQEYPTPYPVDRPGIPTALPAEPASQYQGHDRKQLLALLDHSDEVMGAVARFMSDLREVNRRHRQRFIDLGIATTE